MKHINSERNDESGILSVSSGNSLDSDTFWYWENPNPEYNVSKEWEEIQTRLYSDVGPPLANTALEKECQLWRSTFPHLMVTGKKLELPPIQDTTAEYVEEIIAIDNQDIQTRDNQVLTTKVDQIINKQREKVKKQIVDGVIERLVSKFGVKPRDEKTILGKQNPTNIVLASPACQTEEKYEFDVSNSQYCRRFGISKKSSIESQKSIEEPTIVETKNETLEDDNNNDIESFSESVHTKQKIPNKLVESNYLNKSILDRNLEIDLIMEKTRNLKLQYVNFKKERESYYERGKSYNSKKLPEIKFNNTWLDLRNKDKKRNFTKEKDSLTKYYLEKTSEGECRLLRGKGRVRFEERVTKSSGDVVERDQCDVRSLKKVSGTGMDGKVRKNGYNVMASRSQQRHVDGTQCGVVKSKPKGLYSRGNGPELPPLEGFIRVNSFEPSYMNKTLSRKK